MIPNAEHCIRLPNIMGLVLTATVFGDDSSEIT